MLNPYLNNLRVTVFLLPNISNFVLNVKVFQQKKKKSYVLNEKTLKLKICSPSYGYFKINVYINKWAPFIMFFSKIFEIFKNLFFLFKLLVDCYFIDLLIDNNLEYFFF